MLLKSYITKFCQFVQYIYYYSLDMLIDKDHIY